MTTCRPFVAERRPRVRRLAAGAGLALALAAGNWGLAIELAPESSAGHFCRGQLLTGQRRWAEALPSLNRSLALDESPTDAHNVRGYARYRLGDEAGAVADFDRALQIRPTSSWGWRNLAMVHEEKFEFAAALQEQREAEGLDAIAADGFHIGRLQLYLHDFFQRMGAHAELQAMAQE